MAFNGTLISLGGSAFPMSYIAAGTYKVTPNRRQDIDPFRDANGVLHRNVVSHYATTIEMQTRLMTNTEVADMMAFIRGHYTNEAEKKVLVTFYSPDTDSYDSGEFYLPDLEFTIYKIDGNTITYEPMTLKFIQY